MPILKKTEVEKNFINKQNLDLWNRLSEKYSIIVSDDYQFYELRYVNGDSFAAILANKIYNNSLFTHELLHLDLRSRGLNSSVYFENFKTSQVAGILGGICNCIEHTLFFDDFIEMGYSAHEFTMDYNTSVIDITSLENIYSMCMDLGDAIKELSFISLFWTVKSEEYIGHHRRPQLDWLKKTDLTIFIKCEEMFNDIVDFDLEQPNVQFRFNTIMSKYLLNNY